MNSRQPKLVQKLDQEVEMLRAFSGGSLLPSFAIASALVDKDIISKEDLLCVTSTLIPQVLAQYDLETAAPLLAFQAFLKDPADMGLDLSELGR